MTLEQRIADALSADVTSVDLSALIAETESAAVEAEAAAEQARVRALDPLVLDPTARTAMRDAEFAGSRLRAALPSLHERLKQTAAAEYLARWRADYEVVRSKRDALAAELREVYPALVEQLVDLLRRCAGNDDEISRLHLARPTGVPEHLKTAEQVARSIDTFTTAQPSITAGLRLPGFERGTAMVWPLPTEHPAAAFARMMPVMPHPGANWAAALEERDRQRAEESARVIAGYKQRAKEREEREAREARDRFGAK